MLHPIYIECNSLITDVNFIQNYYIIFEILKNFERESFLFAHTVDRLRFHTQLLKFL